MEATTTLPGPVRDRQPAAETQGAPHKNWTEPRGQDNRNIDVYVGSNPTFENLWNVRDARPTVFARELQQFVDAGYSWDGWYLRASAG